MQKLDFEAAADEAQPFLGVKVGQQLVLARQPDGGWACSTTSDGSSVLCAVPPAAAAALAQQQHQQEAQPTAVIRSIKRSPNNPDAAVSIQVRISFNTQGAAAPVLQQAPAPQDDPTGFCLTTNELQQLAYNEEVCATLGDKRLQEVLLKIDGAANREQALQEAMARPDFREFADKMLHVMKPAQYPAP